MYTYYVLLTLVDLPEIVTCELIVKKFFTYLFI